MRCTQQVTMGVAGGLCRSGVVGLLAAVLWGVAGGAVAAPLPVPPLPQDLPDVHDKAERPSASAPVTHWAGEPNGQAPEVSQVDPAVQPAGFTAAASPHGGSLGPVPLAASPVAGSTVSSPRPVADWSVLAAIGGAFAVLVIFRLRSARRDGGLPSEVFTVLGAGSLSGQHGVRVVRFGPRTLLVGISAAGSHTLAEIEDPAVTERIVAACLARPTSRASARGASPTQPATTRDAIVGGEVA
jgi:hypothetical protein